MYDEFLDSSETRFSKTKIFVDYKEYHNRRNLQEVPRTDKKYFNKQLRIVNKEKQIDKRMPCWASDVELVRKVQIIQNKLLQQNIIQDTLSFASPEDKREFLRPKMEHLVELMDREYEINMKRLKKQRED
jgi:hypothetical protein